jgi:hypothetical protein
LFPVSNWLRAKSHRLLVTEACPYEFVGGSGEKPWVCMLEDDASGETQRNYGAEPSAAAYFQDLSHKF